MKFLYIPVQIVIDTLWFTSYHIIMKQLSVTELYLTNI